MKNKKALFITLPLVLVGVLAACGGGDYTLKELEYNWSEGKKFYFGETVNEAELTVNAVDTEGNKHKLAATDYVWRDGNKLPYSINSEDMVGYQLNFGAIEYTRKDVKKTISFTYSDIVEVKFASTKLVEDYYRVMGSEQAKGAVYITPHAIINGKADKTKEHYLINGNAFCMNTDITEVHIPSTIHDRVGLSVCYGATCFEGTTNLKKVYIEFGGDDITFGSGVFKDSGLEDIYFSGNKTEWNNYVHESEQNTFENCGHVTAHCSDGDIPVNYTL